MGVPERHRRMRALMRPAEGSGVGELSRQDYQVVVQELRLVVEVVVVRKMQVEPEIQVELVELDRLNFRGNLPLSGEFLT